MIAHEARARGDDVKRFRCCGRQKAEAEDGETTHTPKEREVNRRREVCDCTEWEG